MRVRLNFIFAGLFLLCTSCATRGPAIHSSSTGGVYQHAAVAADHPVASQAGLEVLLQGGNAVDAAVATSFTLSVVRPYSCGIGGGGFMVIYTPPTRSSPAEAIAINYREMSPSAVDSHYFVRLNDPLASRAGVHSVAVPGTVAGLLYAHDKYGTLNRETVLAPAIRAATEGFPADPHIVTVQHELAKRLEEYSVTRSHAAFLWDHICRGGQLKVGDHITNPDQARALRLIATHGSDAFYKGEIADAIVRVMQEHGGAITHDDLANYQVSVSKPLHGWFNEYEILAMPPPSSGGVATLQIFAILERLWNPNRHPAHNDRQYVTLLTQMMKFAFADRAEHLADAEFVNVPVKRLLSHEYLDSAAARILASRHVLDNRKSQLTEDGGTSHLSVIDSDGMAVTCTETINLEFGSMVTVPGFGFALNDEMDDFTTIPGEPNAFGLQQSDRNLPESGKRPLSSMSPTIVLNDGRAVMIAGASGGPRIISSTLQAVLNCILFDMTPRESVGAPRFHHQWMPDTLFFDDRWDDDELIRTIERRGIKTTRREDIGVVQLIRVYDDRIEAACDPRKGGAPAGY